MDDQFNGLMAKLSAQATECRALSEEHDSFRDKRMNNTLFLMAVTAAIIQPGELLVAYLVSALVLFSLVERWKGGAGELSHAPLGASLADH